MEMTQSDSPHLLEGYSFFKKNKSHQLLHGADSGWKVIVTTGIGWMDKPGLLHEPLALTSHLSLHPAVLPHIMQIWRLVEAGHQKCGLHMSGVCGGRNSGMFSAPWMASPGKYWGSVEALEDSRPNLIHYGVHAKSRPNKAISKLTEYKSSIFSLVVWVIFSSENAEHSLVPASQKWVGQINTNKKSWFVRPFRRHKHWTDR